MTDARLTKKEQNNLNNFDRLVHFWRCNPDIAAYDIFGMELTWLQRITVRNALKSKFSMILWGRGLGKTTIGALILLLKALLYPGTKCGIFAPAYRQAEQVFDYMEDFVFRSDMIKSSIIYSSGGKSSSRKPYQATMKFKNGSFVRAEPLGDGSKVRGGRYNFVYLEEYAQIDEEVINLAIMPMLNIKIKGRDNQVIASSTAWYSFSHIYKQYLLFNLEKMKKNPSYYLSEFTFLDHLRIKDPPYEYDLDVLERQKNDPTMTEDQFKMENLCYFPLDLTGLFSYKLLDSATPKIVPIDIELTPNNVTLDTVYSMGVDSARTEDGDNFVIQIVKTDRRTGISQLVHCICLNGAEYPIQELVIRRATHLFNIARIYMDLRGGGQALKDLLCQPWTDPQTKRYHLPILDIDDDKYKYINGLRILRMFPSTQPANNMMFSTLKACAEKKILLFPLDILKYGDPAKDKIGMEIIRTKRELYMLRAEQRGQLFHFDVPKGHKKDRAVSLGLANLAAQEILSENRIMNDINALPSGFWVQ